MSRSDEQRRDNVSLALRLMMQDLGEPYERQFHDATASKFAGVDRTTWDELAEQNLVKAWTYDRYRLTGPGWVAGLKLTGKFKDPEFQQKAGKLSAALKAQVKATNRERWGHADRTGLARETGLSEFFIYDAIDSHLLKEMFGDIDAFWGEGDSMKNYIDIPRRCGLTALDEE
jgi:hypothetical protein